MRAKVDGVLAGTTADLQHLPAISEHVAERPKNWLAVLFGGGGVGFFHGLGGQCDAGSLTANRPTNSHRLPFNFGLFFWLTVEMPLLLLAPLKTRGQTQVESNFRQLLHRPQTVAGIAAQPAAAFGREPERGQHGQCNGGQDLFRRQKK